MPRILGSRLLITVLIIYRQVIVQVRSGEQAGYQSLCCAACQLPGPFPRTVTVAAVAGRRESCCISCSELASTEIVVCLLDVGQKIDRS